MMQNKFTVLLLEKDYEIIYNNILNKFKKKNIEIIGTKYEWNKITLLINELIKIDINSLTRIKPMDQFSKMILGLYSFIENNIENDNVAKKEILTNIANTSLVLGIVINGLIDDRNKIKFLFEEFFEDTEVIIFDGKQLLNKQFMPL